MRTILLSIKPEVYDRIFSGEKIVEYRKRFSKEKVKAYLYVSKPVQKIKGILYLGERSTLTGNDFNELSVGNKYKMKILGYQETIAISLGDIMAYDQNFVIPQGFYYLDDKEIGGFIFDNCKVVSEVYENQFDNKYN